MRLRLIRGPGSILRLMSSLWFAAVLLVALLAAMACATVYESMHGTERALWTFYKSWWFELLLALLAVNVAAALVVRYPFSRRQIGFFLTHSGILATLGGALVTKYAGIDGRVGERHDRERGGDPEPSFPVPGQGHAVRPGWEAHPEAALVVGPFVPRGAGEAQLLELGPRGETQLEGLLTTGADLQ